jgi:predicted amidohydrolase YtcJ
MATSLTALILAFLVAVPIPARGTQDTSPGADLVFRGGHVRTSDAAQPSASAVAVRDGRIAYVGDDAGVQALIGSSTRIVDLEGGMLLPGFHDSHVHVAQGGLGLVSCDLTEDATEEAISAHIAACARDNLETAWVTGRGWQPSAFPNANPTRTQLDAIVPDRPAFFMSADGHSAWLNSLAIASAEIGPSTPDPEGGRIERDPVSGEPSGTLRDLAVQLVLGVLPAPTAADFEGAIVRSLQIANSLGITSVHEAQARDPMFSAYQALDERGSLTARVTAAAGIDFTISDLDRVTVEVARLEQLRAQYGGGRFRITAAKLGADGVLESQTAALLEPYVGSDERGPTLLPPAVFAALVLELDRVGMQVHIHSIGDRATRMSLDAIEAARARNGPSGPLHQIAHLQLVDSSDIQRFAPARVAANVQGLWAFRDADVRLVEPFIGPERSGRLYPIGSLQRAGALLVGGSDWSVSSMDPLAAIEVAITRRGPRAAVTQAPLPGEAATLDAMLDAYTINGARAAFHDDQVGSITVGKVADLIVLDRDLTAIPVQEISDAQVVYTFIEGQQVYPVSP